MYLYVKCKLDVKQVSCICICYQTTNIVVVCPSDVAIYEIQYNSYDVSLNREHTPVKKKNIKSSQTTNGDYFIVTILPLMQAWT